VRFVSELAHLAKIADMLLTRLPGTGGNSPTPARTRSRPRRDPASSRSTWSLSLLSRRP